MVAYLKAVRAVQSLKSLRLLQANGLIIDFYTIGRCILDCVNEIDFLLEKYPEDSQTVEKFLKNFREATIDGLLEKGTNRVVSKKIRNASARVWEEEHLTPNHGKAALDKTYKIFSEYVHSQYSVIMEIYGGPHSNQAFQFGGISIEKRKADYLEGIKELDDMVIHNLAYMAKQFSCGEVLREIIQHFDNLETTHHFP